MKLNTGEIALRRETLLRSKVLDEALDRGALPAAPVADGIQCLDADVNVAAFKSCQKDGESAGARGGGFDRPRCTVVVAATGIRFCVVQREQPGKSKDGETAMENHGAAS